MAPPVRLLVPSITLVLFGPAAANHDCNVWTKCGTCVSASYWVPGTGCAWCPADKQCHAEYSPFNSCPSSHVDMVTHVEHCNEPAPGPAPPAHDPKAAALVRDVVGLLFRAFGIKASADTCVKDFTGARVLLREFSEQVHQKEYDDASVSLSRALTSISRSVDGCGLTQLQHKLNAFANKVRWAKGVADASNKTVQILVDASDLMPAIEQLAEAVKSEDTTAIGNKLLALLSEWTAIEGGCKDDEKTCKLVDGLIRALALISQKIRPTAQNMKTCEHVIAPAISNFTEAAELFEAKKYGPSVLWVASGLDVLYQAAKKDECGFKELQDTLFQLSARLKTAVVKIEGSRGVRILIGLADVYDEFYTLVLALRHGDFATAGVQLGALLVHLQSTGCETRACYIIEGFLRVFQVEFLAEATCLKDADALWDDIEDLGHNLMTRQWPSAVTSLGKAFGALSFLNKDCSIGKLGTTLEDTAKKLHMDSVAAEVGTVVQILSAGADASNDFSKMFLDFNNSNWQAVGQDMGQFADWITSTMPCKTLTCKVAEGFFEAGEVLTKNLKACEDDLRKAEAPFRAALASWAGGDKASSLNSFAQGFSLIAEGVKTCGLEDKLAWIEQEGNVLGLGNITELDTISKIIVHGADFYEEVYGAWQALVQHDPHAAAQKFKAVLSDLYKWSTGNLCPTSVCYAVNGMMQFLSDEMKDVSKCKKDFGDAKTYFNDAFVELSGHDSIFSAFSQDNRNVSKGIADLGYGLRAISKSVGDCHLQEFLTALEELAAILTTQPPELQWLEAFLKIIIDGVDIEVEVSNALVDFGNHNWPGFGYNLFKLIKTLLSGKAQQTQAATMPKMLPRSEIVI
eukprot:TRINITY_DN10581_c0_g1_i1.p1 TRINITY_DN10581_c0_g1~~TRINITY_DN10581_c0_g1_i1.p1  ORF type:complete len:856 (+),score=251.75 TRINITY_DN10581_c0_g1_i1:97-2664(+)